MGVGVNSNDESVGLIELSVSEYLDSTEEEGKALFHSFKI